MSVEAVVFDLDGVLIDSEQAWDDARRELIAGSGGTWTPEASRAMMGMSSKEWPSYMAGTVGLPLAPEAINAEVVRRMRDAYARDLPLLPGALQAAERLGARWPPGPA